MPKINSSQNLLDVQFKIKVDFACTQDQKQNEFLAEWMVVYFPLGCALQNGLEAVVDL